jgi:hypothetical protein
MSSRLDEPEKLVKANSLNPAKPEFHQIREFTKDIRISAMDGVHANECSNPNTSFPLCEVTTLP